MELTQQFVWPLLGVLLGWLLSAISSGWKSRLERKKAVGRLLTSLLDVRNDVRALRAVSSQMKNLLTGPQQYESFRQHISENYFLNHGASASHATELIVALSAYKPVEAFQLNAVLKLLSRSKAARLNASSEHPEAYTQLISLHEAGLRMAEIQLTKTVRSLALSHGLLTSFQLFFKLRRSDTVASDNEQFIGASAKEIIGKYRDRT